MFQLCFSFGFSLVLQFFYIFAILTRYYTIVYYVEDSWKCTSLFIFFSKPASLTEYQLVVQIFSFWPSSLCTRNCIWNMQLLIT